MPNALTELRFPEEDAPASSARLSPDTLALLAERRSVKLRMLSEPGPSQDELAALLKLAARVPDHGKLGPWRFAIIVGDARARLGAALARVISEDSGIDENRLEIEAKRFTYAPLCVMVVSTAAPHPKIPEWEQLHSAGAVCQNLLVAAHAMGFAGCWLTEWPAYDERARPILGLKDHERIVGFVSLGTATQPVTERKRPDLEPRISYF
ncbi:MAG: nitroreductase [Hyphomonadaceae bacterium]|nr:nitroreductase [Hyphomonadaceae bacterium]